MSCAPLPGSRPLRTQGVARRLHSRIVATPLKILVRLNVHPPSGACSARCFERRGPWPATLPSPPSAPAPRPRAPEPRRRGSPGPPRSPPATRPPRRSCPPAPRSTPPRPRAAGDRQRSPPGQASPRRAPRSRPRTARGKVWGRAALGHRRNSFRRRLLRKLRVGLLIRWSGVRFPPPLPTKPARNRLSGLARAPQRWTRRDHAARRIGAPVGALGVRPRASRDLLHGAQRSPHLARADGLPGCWPAACQPYLPPVPDWTDPATSSRRASVH